MDSLTQAVLGAGIAGSVLGRFHGRKALVAGALLATVPDLDVFIDYGNPVSAMINHRGFSHSVFVLSALAVLLTWLIRRYRPAQNYGTARLFIALWLVLITHPLLDAFTSYGTQLFWPFKPTPISWSSIFIIDPFFTVPLVFAVLTGFIAGTGPRSRRVLNWTLSFCVAYLALSLVGKTIAESRLHKELTQEGTQVQAMFSTPEPFSILLWRVVARTTDDHYEEAIIGLLDQNAPERLRLPLNSALAQALPHFALLSGLRWFTDDWLRYDDIDGHLVATDLRMGLGTGFYSFRFLMAQRQSPDGVWEAVVPSRWPTERLQAALNATIQRIWRQSPPLPLASWEPRMTATQPN